MKLFSEKNYYKAFKISLVVKAFDGICEATAGFFLYFVNHDTINRVLVTIFQEEIAEAPRDLFWGYLIHEWHVLLLSTQSFWGLLFIIHGLTKIVLVVLLLKKQLWAYPVAAGVFSLFVIYELYTLIAQPSLLLGLLSVFDVLIVGLILHEYKYAKVVISHSKH